MKKCHNKNCVHGDKLQENSEFYKHPHTKDRLQPACKSCYKAYSPYVKVKDRLKNDWDWIYRN